VINQEERAEDMADKMNQEIDSRDEVIHIHCVSKKFTLFVFTVTQSDVDRF